MSVCPVDSGDDCSSEHRQVCMHEQILLTTLFLEHAGLHSREQEIFYRQLRGNIKAKDISNVIVSDKLDESHFRDEFYDVVSAEYKRLRCLFKYSNN